MSSFRNTRQASRDRRNMARVRRDPQSGPQLRNRQHRDAHERIRLSSEDDFEDVRHSISRKMQGLPREWPPELTWRDGRDGSKRVLTGEVPSPATRLRTRRHLGGLEHPRATFGWWQLRTEHVPNPAAMVVFMGTPC